MPARKKAASRRPVAVIPPEQVIIDFAVLGDFAQASGGKLTIVGAGWNVVNAHEYPQKVPFGLGIGILIPWSETNTKHQFAFVIQDADGNQLLSSGGQVEAGRKAGLPAGMTQRVVLGVAGQMELPRPGAFVIIVSVAGNEKRIPFEALPVEALRLGTP